jgi:hypothetical protein
MPGGFAQSDPPEPEIQNQQEYCIDLSPYVPTLEGTRRPIYPTDHVRATTVVELQQRTNANPQRWYNAIHETLEHNHESLQRLHESQGFRGRS